MSDSIDAVLQLPQRKIVVAENDVSYKQIKNDIFILMVEESTGSARGRAVRPQASR